MFHPAHNGWHFFFPCYSDAVNILYDGIEFVMPPFPLACKLNGKLSILQKKIGVNYLALEYDVKASNTNWTQFSIKCTQDFEIQKNIV